MYYSMERRAALKAAPKDPKDANKKEDQKEFLKGVGADWKALTPEQKKPFDDKAKAAKEEAKRKDAELIAFKEEVAKQREEEAKRHEEEAKKRGEEAKKREEDLLKKMEELQKQLLAASSSFKWSLPQK